MMLMETDNAEVIALVDRISQRLLAMRGSDASGRTIRVCCPPEEMTYLGDDVADLVTLFDHYARRV